ncbi:MAG: hypothetical protein CMJ68_21290 [Planctomycetaceae bacterium]|nr:hypothetical protein [Planctomycetaceae bacterium]
MINKRRATLVFLAAWTFTMLTIAVKIWEEFMQALESRSFWSVLWDLITLLPNFIAISVGFGLAAAGVYVIASASYSAIRSMFQ